MYSETIGLRGSSQWIQPEDSWLPKDVIILVTSHLELRDRIFGAGSVSPLWRQAALDTSLVELDLTPSGLFGFQFQKRVLSTTLPSHNIEGYIERYKATQKAVGHFLKEAPKVNLKSVLGLRIVDANLAVLDALAAFMPNLESINADNFTDTLTAFNQENFEAEIDALKRWKYLSALKCLGSLQLPRCDFLNPGFNCGRLTELEISPMGIRVGTPFYNTFLPNRDLIKVLVLDLTGQGDTHTFPFGPFPSLERLTLRLSNDASSKIDSIINNLSCPELEFLELSFAYPRNRRTLGHLRDLQPLPLPPLAKFSKVSTLRLTECPTYGINSASIAGLRLQEFFMEDGATINTNLLPVLATMVSLKRLTFFLGRNDGDLTELKKLSNLEHLSLKGGYSVESLKIAIRHLKLTSLSLHPTKYIEWRVGWRTMQEHTWPIDLSKSQAIIRGLSSLPLRDLSINVVFDRATLNAICESFPTLEALEIRSDSLEGNFSGNKYDLDFIGSKLSRLRSLKIDIRPKSFVPPTPQQFESLVNKAKHLKYIRFGSAIILNKELGSERSNIAFVASIAGILERYHVDFELRPPFKDW